MKQILLAAVVNGLRLYVGSGLFDRIAAEVLRLAPLAVPGADKMAAVLAFAQREAVTLAETLIRAVVEVVLLQRLKA